MVGIVILDYNNAPDTINCFESVRKYSRKGTYKIIIVENGSDYDTVNVVYRYLSNNISEFCIVNDTNYHTKDLAEITLLISNTNDGYAEGNNKALRIFEKDDDIDKIMVLNSDIIFTEDIITPLSKKIDTLPKCAIVSPMLLKRDGFSIDHCCARRDYMLSQFIFEYLFAFMDICGLISRREKKRSILLQNPELAKRDYFEIELPSGSCMMIDKSFFKKIGYFDKNTFLYFEENILYCKIKALHMKNYLIPSQKCIHLGGSTSKSSPSLFLMKCQMKSTAYYLRKYRHSTFWSKYVSVMSFLTITKIKIQGLFIRRNNEQDS